MEPTGRSGRARGRVRRGLWLTLLVIASLLVVIAVFQGLTSDLRPAENEPEAVFQTESVARADLQETVAATGRMEPLVRVPVIAEVSGVIAQVHVEEGDRVRRGQPLFELDRERLEARVAERRAALELRKASARYDLVGRAEVELDRARREFERTRSLRERNVASEFDFERREHELRLAEITLRDAHAETTARHAAVTQAREMLRQAERDLANAVVRAPIDGVIIEREGEIGRAVADVTNSGGTVIAVIADDRRIRLVAEVDENDIGRVRPGQLAQLTIDAFPQETFGGRVRKISAAGSVDGNIANFEIEVEVPPDPRLRVGMSSDARIVVREHEAALLVPNRALVRRDGESFVRVPEVGGGAYRFAPVRIGYSDGFKTVIAGGLEEGEPILVRRDEDRL